MASGERVVVKHRPDVAAALGLLALGLLTEDSPLYRFAQGKLFDARLLGTEVPEYEQRFVERGGAVTPPSP